MLNFETLDEMLDYHEAHEDECDMWVGDGYAYLSKKGSLDPISSRIQDEKCWIICFGYPRNDRKNKSR